MKRLLQTVSAITLSLFLAPTNARALEILHLTFENGSDLTEDSSGAGLVSGSLNSINFGGSLAQSSDTHSAGGSNSASFVPFIAPDPNLADDGAVNIEFTGAGLPDFSASDSFTFSLWVKPSASYLDDTQGFRGIAAGLTESGSSATFEWQLDNGASFDPNDPNSPATASRMNAQSSPNVDLIDGGNLDPNQWTHVALTYLGSSRTTLFFIGDESTNLTYSAVSTGGQGLALEELLLGSNRNRELFFEGLMDDVRLFDTSIIYDGTGGEFEYGDLNFSGGSVDPNDWVSFRANMGTDLSAELPLDAYAKGDLDFDGDNDFDDFQAFKTLFNAANPLISFEQMIAGVPEPTTSLLALCALIGICGARSRGQRRSNNMLILFLGLSWLITCANTTQAQTVINTIANSTLIDLPEVNDGGSYLTTITDRDSDPNTGNHLVPSFTRTYTITEGFVSFDYDLTLTGGNGNLHNFNGPTFSYGIDNSGGSDNNALDDAGPSNPESITFAVSNITQTAGPVVPITFDGFSALSVFFSAQVSDAGAITNGTSDIWSFDGNLGTNPVDGDPNTPSGTKVLGNSSDDSLFEWFGLRQHAHAQVDLSTILPSTMVYEVRSPTNTSDNNRVRLNAVGVQFTIDIDPFVPFTIDVDTATGDMTLTNSNMFGLDIDYIEIRSPDVELNGGSLDPNMFSGLGSDPNFPLGTGVGNGWELSESNSEFKLIESYLTGSTSLDPNASIDLGAGFVPGSTQDLEFFYHVVGEDELRQGLVSYSGLAGDFNGDGRVDGADFLAWQRNPALGDLADWTANYGTPVSSSTTAVPEPAAITLLLFGCGTLLRTRRVL